MSQGLGRFCAALSWKNAGRSWKKAGRSWKKAGRFFSKTTCFGLLTHHLSLSFGATKNPLTRVSRACARVKAIPHLHYWRQKGGKQIIHYSSFAFAQLGGVKGSYGGVRGSSSQAKRASSSERTLPFSLQSAKERNCQGKNYRPLTPSNSL